MKKLILTAVCVLAAVVGAAAQSQYVSSMKGNVNLRTAPSTSAAKAGTMTAADLLPCLEELDGWYKVDFNGKPVFVSQSVATTCDAVVPEEMFGKDLTSSRPWDKIRHQGSIRIDKIDSNHVFIHMDWMRVNLPAESWSYLATLKDGRIIATHSSGMWVDSEDRPLKDILEEVSPLDKPVPVGYGEFNNTIYFNGAEFSEFE